MPSGEPRWDRPDAYEAYVGRWSRLVAKDFLDWIHAPTGGIWLDVGCGTGELTRAILKGCAPSPVTGVDPSSPFLASAINNNDDVRAQFHNADARALPFPDAHFDVVVSGLVLNFVPEPDRALLEMARVTRLGGIVAAYVWDYAGKMEMMRHFFDAAIALDPVAAEVDEGPRFPICNPERLAELFQRAGLSAVETRAIEVPTPFRDFDDYWTPFLGGTGVAPAYAMSLPEERRAALRERLRDALPIAQDGTIPLIARAWAVKGMT